MLHPVQKKCTAPEHSACLQKHKLLMEHVQVSTPLHMAAAKGHLSIVDTLLAHEADTTAKDFGVGTHAASYSCL